MHRVFPSSRRYSASSRKFQFHWTYVGDSKTVVTPFLESELRGYPLGFSSETVLKGFPLHGCSASSACESISLVRFLADFFSWHSWCDSWRFNRFDPPPLLLGIIWSTCNMSVRRRFLYKPIQRPLCFHSNLSFWSEICCYLPNGFLHMLNPIIRAFIAFDFYMLVYTICITFSVVSI